MKICWTLKEAKTLADLNNSNPANKPMCVVRVGINRWVVVHADSAKYFHEYKDE